MFQNHPDPTLSRTKLKPLRKGGIRKPYLFWSELIMIKLNVKKVTWSNELTVHEYCLDP